MKKIIGCTAICLLLILFLSPSFSPAQNNNTRVYRGVINHIGYDLKENRARVDVYNIKNKRSEGRGQLYFGRQAARHLIDMIHLAFIQKIEVEIWVYKRDAKGRPNVIHTVNFKSRTPSGKRVLLQR